MSNLIFQSKIFLLRNFADDVSSFIFGYRDNSILAHARDNVFLFDFEANKVVKTFKEVGEDISKAAMDPHYNRVGAIDLKLAIVCSLGQLRCGSFGRKILL